MEGLEVLHRELERLRKDNRREQVDGVPDAAMRQKAVEHSEQGHGNAACQSSLDPRLDWVNFDGDSRPSQLWHDSRYFMPLGDDPRDFWLHRHGLVTFVGQYLTEPSNRTRDGQDGAEGTHGNACQK